MGRGTSLKRHETCLAGLKMDRITVSFLFEMPMSCWRRRPVVAGRSGAVPRNRAKPMGKHVEAWQLRRLEMLFDNSIASKHMLQVSHYFMLKSASFGTPCMRKPSTGLRKPPTAAAVSFTLTGHVLTPSRIFDADIRNQSPPFENHPKMEKK